MKLALLLVTILALLATSVATLAQLKLAMKSAEDKVTIAAKEALKLYKASFCDTTNCACVQNSGGSDMQAPMCSTGMGSCDGTCQDTDTQKAERQSGTALLLLPPLRAAAAAVAAAAAADAL